MWFRGPLIGHRGGAVSPHMYPGAVVSMLARADFIMAATPAADVTPLHTGGGDQPRDDKGGSGVQQAGAGPR